MRKQNQRRPRAIPCNIPRPPTPSQSDQVQSLKKMLQTNRETSSSLSRVIPGMTSSDTMTDSTTSRRVSSPASTGVINSHPHRVQQRNHQHPPSISQQNCNQRLPPQLHPKLQARESSHSSSLSFMKESSSSDSSNSDTASSSSQEVTNEPGDAIEPNEEFPAPPEEFLEDIKAFRKQEEIEGPLNSSSIPSSISNHFDSIPSHLSRSFNGNGSLNSSITETETTESSWSPSNSPISSPLPSPSPSTSSISSFNPEESSGQRFVFPPGHPLTSSPTRHSFRIPSNHHSYPRLPPHPSFPDPSLRHRMSSRGVTLAPLHFSSLEKHSIYQRLPPNAYSCLPRMPSSPSALSTSSGSSISSSKSALRPPDYMTAMQRLSLSKVNTSKMPSGLSQSLSSSSLPVSASVQSIHQNNQSRAVNQPLKSIPSLSSSLPEKQSLTTISESVDGIPDRLRRSSVSSSCSEESRQSGQASSSQPKSRGKKRVSFSDHVELVAHSEDMKEEEHLPNPLLERVLGKDYLNSNNIRNG